LRPGRGPALCWREMEADLAVSPALGATAVRRAEAPGGRHQRKGTDPAAARPGAGWDRDAARLQGSAAQSGIYDYRFRTQPGVSAAAVV